MPQYNHAMAPAVISKIKIREELQLLAPVAKTATANLTALDLICTGPEQAIVTLNVGAVTGTAPTLDVKMQESDDNSTFVDIAGAAFTQVTAATNLQQISFTRSKRYVRAALTIAGTTPSFTMGMTYGH